jgi:hypothetical protein
MPRTLRPESIGGHQVHTTNVTLLATDAVTNATIAVAGLVAPNVGARLVKWWIKKVTAGTGTGDITAFLVVNAGTSSTRQIGGSIVVDTDLAGPNITEAIGFGGGLYEIAAGDTHKALDLIYSLNTTNTNAPAGFTIGCVWSV